jgi:branched-chain amino acid transport system permease protein
VLYAMVGLSLLVLTGWAGLISLGQFAFAAVGGWVALFTGLPVLLALPVGALAGALAAVIIGAPSIRLRGLSLAISTLAFGVTVSLLLVNPRYGGSLIDQDVDRPVVLGFDLDDQRVAFYLALLVLGLAVAGITGLRRSRTGRVLLASRENEIAAQALGVSLLRARLTAFAISGGIAAMAGVLFAYQQGGVRPDSFSPDVSVTLFAFVVMGGLGSIAGPILGFALFAIVSIFSSLPWVLTLVSGAGGLLLLLTSPGGLVEIVVRGRDAVLGRVASRRRIRVPHLHEPDDEERAPIQPRRTSIGEDDVAERRWSLSSQWTTPDLDGADDEPALAIARLSDVEALDV